MGLDADDNCDAADALVGLLEALGHRAFVAYDGVQACDAFSRWHPDIAILDVRMPRMDGCAAAARMRDDARRPKLIVSVTGMRRDREPMLFRAGVFDEHLAKPCDMGELDRSLRRADLVCADASCLAR